MAIGPTIENLRKKRADEAALLEMLYSLPTPTGGFDVNTPAERRQLAERGLRGGEPYSDGRMDYGRRRPNQVTIDVMPQQPAEFYAREVSRDILGPRATNDLFGYPQGTGTMVGDMLAGGGMLGAIGATAPLTAWDAGAAAARGDYGDAALKGIFSLLEGAQLGELATGARGLRAVANEFPEAAQEVGQRVRGFLADESGSLPLPFSAPNPPRKITAYQGSPHDFSAERLVQMPDGSTQYIVGSPDVLPDVPAGATVLQDFPLGRMRTDKINTGEGAQAYGHGLYVAEAEPVALGYRQRLAKVDTAEAEKIGIPPNQLNTFKMFARQTDPTQPEAAARDFANWTGTAYTPELVQAYKNTFKNSGKMYEVNIDADPNQFLDWDKLLSEQPEIASLLGYSDAARIAAEKAKLYGQFSAPKSMTYDDLFGPLSAQEKAAAEQLAVIPEPWNELTGKDAWFRASKRRYAVQGPDGKFGAGGNTYEEALRMAGGDANKVRTISDSTAPARAEFMRDTGVKGIKFLDQGSRNVGQGSSNYVIFDENLISIVRKYGIATAAAMLGMSQADVAQAMGQQQPQPMGLLSGDRR